MEKAFAELMKGSTPNYTDHLPDPPVNPSRPVDSIPQEKIKTENEKDSQEKLEWEKQVANFTFSNLITVQLRAGEKETFFEEITEPTTIRLAFMVNHPTKKIDFSLIGPKGDGKKQTITNPKGRNYFFYEYTAMVPGVYSFNILNNRYKESGKVTFAINSNKAEDKTIDSSKLDVLSERLVKIDNKIGELKMKFNLVVKKVEGHNKSVQKHNKSIIVFSILEVLTMIIIFAIQSFYLTKLINKV